MVRQSLRKDPECLKSPFGKGGFRQQLLMSRGLTRKA